METANNVMIGIPFEATVKIKGNVPFIIFFSECKPAIS